MKIFSSKKVFSLLFASFFSLVAYAQTDVQQLTQMAHNYSSVGDTAGIYVLTSEGYRFMEPVKYTGIKTNALGTALSYGIAKTKVKLEFAGATAPYKVSSPAKFRIYFGMVPASKVQKLYMFSSSGYSIRDIAISQFKVKKNKRQLVQGSYSLWGGSSTGVETDQSVNIETNEVREGVYDVTVTAAPGEYCFVFTAQGIGGFSPVFDFTIQ